MPQPKQSSVFKDKVMEDCADDYKVEEEENYGCELRFSTKNSEVKKKKVDFCGGYGNKGSTSGGVGEGLSPPRCQAEKCTADLTIVKKYHRRHKVCELHAKAPAVIVNGLRQRFCQQCSRFHELSEFDDTKRSCRRRLAGHNKRRRKSSSESTGEGSSRKRLSLELKENHCRPANGQGRNLIGSPGNPTYKQFRIC